MAAPDEVKRLVERFHGDRERLKRVQFGETETRVQFINPLFEALGWDVTNAMNSREVVHEDAVRVGMAHKAPDYGFYAAQERKFFVEAKKPSVNLLTNPEPAFQLRRYAWSARLPVSVLTDFEEFAIYDTRVQPDQADRASVARLSHITYESYADRWDEIAGLFSKAAVYDGVLEKWVESQRRPKGATVDRAFLTEIERWRALLARAIAAGNPELTQRELNYAVQMTVDRILFLRMAEDRGIEEYGRLLALVNGADVYQRLRDLYRQADERYNSGLFHFREERDRAEGYDALTPGLTIDDTALKDIFKNLYYPHSPYEFSVLPVDVLGQVYEQFLGKVIALDSNGRVEIEEKPEVRKAGGVYYTPTYIVDYIVAHTVGKLLEGKTPRQAEKLRILDPSCGSGSFLLGAYEYLLAWHRDWYVADGPEKHRKVLYQGLAGEWRLTTEARKTILRNNIYGVDIDAQAVEVTKLSLMLKLLEGETSGTLTRQLSFAYRERVLPDLGDNIKCGNSLIGPDFYDNPQMTFLSSEDQYRINVFDWQAEFSEIMKAGGFDVVIGNPPYDVMEKERGAASWPHSSLRDYVTVRPEYAAALGGKLNLFRFFVVRSLTLVRDSGRFGMIVPLAILADISCAQTRRFVMSSSENLIADCFPQKDNANRRVFVGAKLSTVILTSSRVAVPSNDCTEIAVRVYPWNNFTDPRKESCIRLSDTALLDPKNLPIPLVDDRNWALCIRIHSQPYVVRIGDAPWISVTRGEINQTVYRKFINSDPTMARLLKGVEVGQFRFNRELSQGTREWLDEDSFLRANSAREQTAKPRVATQRITGVDERLRVVATIIQPPMYFADSTNSVAVDSPHYKLENMCGILNSQLIQWRFKITSTNNNVGTNEIDSLPVRTIDFANPADFARHDQMVALVDRMLSLNEQVQTARTGQDRTMLQRQIDAIDRQIDRLVYELYGLTDDEIAIVEAATARQA